MSIQATLSADSQVLTISVKGRFDFGAHQDFRNAYERSGLTPQAVSYTPLTLPTNYPV